MRSLLLATTNRHKLEEYRAIFSGLPFKLLSLHDVRLDLDVEETGTTFAENAEIKALTYARVSGLLSLADDSGLEIDALGGAPGVYSARFVGGNIPPAPNRAGNDALLSGGQGHRDSFAQPERKESAPNRAGNDATASSFAQPERKEYEERFRIILERLKELPPEQRSARFHCAITLAEPSGYYRTVEGTLEGQIADAPRGNHGFGYDPIFLVPELGKTTAELTPAEKNRISHRGRAARLAAALLKSWPAG